MTPQPQQVPPPPRKTLLEWITDDDRDQPDHAQPVCAPAVQALHFRIIYEPPHADDGPREPLAPPPGFGLAPLG